ncbi:MAG: DUF4870 domain-containing protein [Oscillospiraceae bacterium]|nr:DUF4870 domain-containing protein [Oscillospiraceae bacterium]
MAAPQFEEDKKVVATVAVFPILFLIYFIAGKDSAYVRYCANQGLIFTILGIIISVVANVIGIIPIIGFLAGIVFWLIDLAILVLTIYQMIGAFKGTIKPLPVIGDVEILK